MRRLSAQYIITATGAILRRGIITCDDEGRIQEVRDTGGELPELHSTEFYNGIIVPGFVNCHCHTELSSMHKKTVPGSGLGEFIRKVRETRAGEEKQMQKDIAAADKMMYEKGISACGDICNSSISFDIKEKSPIEYINFLEVFGVDPARADIRISEVLELKKKAGSYSARSYIVPHSFYSMSAALLEKVKEVAAGNEVHSIHFMESGQEKIFLEDAEGPLMESYLAMGIDRSMLQERVKNHIEGIKNYISPTGNLLLVHNTYAGRQEISAAMERGSCFFCLCPASNLFIENTVPPVNTLREMGAEIVLGTDSLASNKGLDILGEMKIISKELPSVPLEEMVRWATINGARALRIDKDYGSIEEGKKPGLVLLENTDLATARLTPGSRALRLV